MTPIRYNSYSGVYTLLIILIFSLTIFLYLHCSIRLHLNNTNQCTANSLHFNSGDRCWTVGVPVVPVSKSALDTTVDIDW